MGRGGRGEAVKNNDRVLIASLYAAFQRWVKNIWAVGREGGSEGSE